VHITKGKLNLGDELVKNGLAVYYDGGTKIKDWCK
jgi:endonuclease YncB( thermonuclease family)